MLRKYPLSLITISIISDLSLFQPPQMTLTETPFMDKIAHICMYGGLGLIIWFEYLRRHPRLNKKQLINGAILVPFLFSGGIELIQEYGTTYRGGDWLDWLCNSIGILSAAFIGYYFLRPFMSKYLQRKRK